MNSSVKRKRAGGSAISGSTKRQHDGAAAWREELAEEGDDGAGADGEAAPAASTDIRVALGLSSEEEIMDPGTPLPSEDEAEGAAAAAGDPDATPDASAEVDAAEEAATAAATAAGDGTEGPVVATAQAPESSAGLPAERGTSAARPETIWLEVVTGEDGDDERASEPMEVLLREGLRQAVLDRLTPCLPPGRGAAVNALVQGRVCTFANHGPLKLLREAEEPGGEGGAAVNGTPVAANVPDGVPGENGKAAAMTNGQATKGSAMLPEAFCHGMAGLLTAPRDAPGLALTLGSAHSLNATHDVLGPVLLGRRVVRQLGALAPLVGGPAPAKPLSLRAVPSAPAEALPSTETASSDAMPTAPARPKVASAAVPVDSRPFLLEETAEPSVAEELEVLGLDLDTREAEVQELKQQVFSRERQEGVVALDSRLATAQQQLERLEVDSLAGEGREVLEAQGMWLKERIRHLVRLAGKLK